MALSLPTMRANMVLNVSNLKSTNYLSQVCRLLRDTSALLSIYVKSLRPLLALAEFTRTISPYFYKFSRSMLEERKVKKVDFIGGNAIFAKHISISLLQKS